MDTSHRALDHEQDLPAQMPPPRLIIDPVSGEETRFEDALRARYERLSLLTLDLAEEAGEAVRSFSYVDRREKPGRFERGVAAMTKAIWAHQSIERLRKGECGGEAVLPEEIFRSCSVDGQNHGACEGGGGHIPNYLDEVIADHVACTPGFTDDLAMGLAAECGPAIVDMHQSESDDVKSATRSDVDETKENTDRASIIQETTSRIEAAAEAVWDYPACADGDDKAKKSGDAQPGFAPP